MTAIYPDRLGDILIQSNSVKECRYISFGNLYLNFVLCSGPKPIVFLNSPELVREAFMRQSDSTSNRMYSLLCKLYLPYVTPFHLCRLHSLSCKLPFVLCKFLSILCTLHFRLCKVHSLLCKLHAVLCKLHSLICKLHFLQCKLQSLLYKLHVLLCKLHFLLCELHVLLCKLHSLLCNYIFSCVSYTLSSASYMYTLIHPPGNSLLLINVV